MSRDLIKEECDIKDELKAATRSLLAVLTPTTERFAAIETTIRQILTSLDAHNQETTLAIVGQPGSGRSSLINGVVGMNLIPPHNRSLAVVPFVSETPMLRLTTGKAVAVGETSCREQLVTETNLQLNSPIDRRLHAPLPVMRGPHCFRNKWVMMDLGGGAAAVIPKLSSVATRVATVTQFAGSMILYCVDATKLGSADEASVFDMLLGQTRSDDISENGIHRLLQRVVFVLTNADRIFDIEDGFSLKRDPPQIEIVRTVDDLRRYFTELLLRCFPQCRGLVSESQIITFSGRNAFLTKRILMFEPDVQELYDYCEIMFGKSFMQTVDDMDLDQLRRMVQRFAENEMLQKSGALSLTKLIRLFDFNATIHLLRDNGHQALDGIEQLQRALDNAKPAVIRETLNCRDELEHLVQETTWVLEHSEKISEFAAKMTDEITVVASRSVKEFFQARLHELRYVLEGRPLVWFNERQACTIMEIKSALAKISQFTEQYMLHRGYMEKRMRDQQSSTGGFEFLDEHGQDVLRAMEDTKRELLHTFNTAVAHHVKDEFTRYVASITDSVHSAQVRVVRDFISLTYGPVSETTSRTNQPFDLDSLEHNLIDCLLVEENDRRVKNFLRELPEHVAIAAVEISNQWYVALDEAAVSHPKLPSKRELYEQRLKLATAKEGDVEDESEFKMPPQLLYILEAWRLSFGVVQLHQLCTFNLHTFTQNVAIATERVLNFVNELVTSLEEGTIAQKDDVLELERVAEEIGNVQERLVEVKSHLQKVLTVIDNAAVHDIASAEQLAESSL